MYEFCLASQDKGCHRIWLLYLNIPYWYMPWKNYLSYKMIVGTTTGASSLWRHLMENRDFLTIRGRSFSKCKKSCKILSWDPVKQVMEIHNITWAEGLDSANLPNLSTPVSYKSQREFCHGFNLAYPEMLTLSACAFGLINFGSSNDSPQFFRPDMDFKLTECVNCIFSSRTPDLGAQISVHRINCGGHRYSLLINYLCLLETRIFLQLLNPMTCNDNYVNFHGTPEKLSAVSWL